MSRFSHLQKKIALELLKGKKSIHELSRATGESDSLVEKELNSMQKLSLVEKDQDYFRLKKEISTELKRRNEIEQQDSFKARFRAFVESQAYSEKLVKSNIDTLVEQMEKDQDYKIYAVDKSEPEKQGDLFSGFVEVNFSVKDFNSIIRFVLVFGPSSIELVKPRKIEFTAYELQEGLMDLTGWVYKYNQALVKNMRKQEIENFTKTLFQQKKK